MFFSKLSVSKFFKTAVNIYFKPSSALQTAFMVDKGKIKSVKLSEIKSKLAEFGAFGVHSDVMVSEILIFYHRLLFKYSYLRFQKFCEIKSSVINLYIFRQAQRLIDTCRHKERFKSKDFSNELPARLRLDVDCIN